MSFIVKCAQGYFAQLDEHSQDPIVPCFVDNPFNAKQFSSWSEALLVKWILNLSDAKVFELRTNWREAREVLLDEKTIRDDMARAMTKKRFVRRRREPK